MMAARKPKLWTMPGLSRLGKEILRSRKEQGWSQDRLVEVIRERTGQEITKQTISRLERGGQMPERNTLAIIAAAQFIRNRAGIPYTEAQLSDIASEVLDPEATEELEPSDEEDENKAEGRRFGASDRQISQKADVPDSSIKPSVSELLPSLMQTSPLPVVARAIAIGTARLKIAENYPASSVSPLIPNHTQTLHNGGVDLIGCERMFHLSGVETQRLHALVIASIEARGFLDVEQAVENSGIHEHLKWLTATTLRAIISRTGFDSQDFPNSIFGAISSVCVRVHYWRSHTEPTLLGTQTYAGDAHQLKAALEMPVSNGSCVL
ncbi:MAG TPA: helix-turn-helix transcriptional regulator [Thermosynechococcaceae cyanobacterium]|jgi:transcriptional regulator with XRE-family HTH domain